MEKYVLDTNIFFNISSDLNLGKKTEEVIVNLTTFIKKLKKEKKAEFFMPPSIVDEFLSFFEDKYKPFLTDFLSLINVKNPTIDNVFFSARVFYLLVDEVRKRAYRGLNIGEEEIKNAAKKFLSIKQELSKKEFELSVGEIIKKFRLRYRQTTRFGFLDSTADLDLIVLTKEIDGFLVSTDEGVLLWGKTFGVKIMSALGFRRRLEHLFE